MNLEEVAKQELAELREEHGMSHDLGFRDLYVLDFLNLKDALNEPTSACHPGILTTV